MFNELPKLFDRNFAIGYVLPVLLFFVVTGFLLSQFGVYDLVSVLESTTLLGTTLIVIVVWIVGMLLLALNWFIYRIFEGYWPASMWKIWTKINGDPCRKRYNYLINELYSLDTQTLHHSDAEEPTRRAEIMQELVMRFPDDEQWLLPTAFGNAIRAFEVYSRVMYGVEGIQGWNRLRVIISKDCLALVDDAKALTDVWMNLWLGSIILIIEYFVLAATRGILPIPWFILVMVGAVWLFSRFATTAAIGWGEMVKSTFDIYLPKLRETLGQSNFENSEQEHLFWQRYSQAILYRLPDQLPTLQTQGNLEEPKDVIDTKAIEAGGAAEELNKFTDEQQKSQKKS